MHDACESMREYARVCESGCKRARCLTRHATLYSQAGATFQSIHDAYDVLSKDNLRWAYDTYGTCLGRGSNSIISAPTPTCARLCTPGHIGVLQAKRVPNLGTLLVTPPMLC